jgi:hypothetical protein
VVVKKMWDCRFGNCGAAWGSYIELKLGGSSGQPQCSTKPEDQLLHFLIYHGKDRLTADVQERERAKDLRSGDQGLQHDQEDAS